MIIHFSYFGVPIPSLTHEKKELELPNSITIEELMNIIGEKLDESEEGLLTKATFLVNKMGAKRDRVLHDGDDVIIMFPIGGG